MHLHPASKSKSVGTARLMRPASPLSNWTASGVGALVLAAILLFTISSAVFYFNWDQMPERVQYLSSRITARFVPERAHPSYVSTPVAAIAPEQALESMQLGTVGTAAAPAESARPPPAVTDIAPAADTSAPVVAPVEEMPVEAEQPVVAEQPVTEAAPVEAAPAAPLFQPALPSATLQNVRHEFQGWNNCGPATLAMNLSYFGRTETQAQTAPFLKPGRDDKNVSPNEMAAYAASIGYGSKVVVGADLDLMRTLVTNGFPVTVESWFIPEPDDEMGHYLLLTGYEGDTLTFYDSYHGPDVRETAAEFDELWKVFNRTAIVIWPPEREQQLMAILGERADPQRMVELALATAHEEVNRNPQDKFAWFNLGTNLTALGDAANAVRAFDTARSLQLPWRMLWYQFGPFEAYYNAGNYQEVVNLTTATLAGADKLEESFFWRGRALAAAGQNDAARRDFEQAIRLNANFHPAHHALSTLP